MRTTLDLDEVVLSAARSLARACGISLGAAVSQLAMRGLQLESGGASVADVSYAAFPVLIGDPDHIVTPELVNRYRDDE
ncbi:MAG: DUF2191 domain-containing protein [Actinomycetales bacterium]